MKILIGYDGSQYADTAIRDLPQAGLPSEADCIVLTIADVWLPPPPQADDEASQSQLDPHTEARLREMKQAAISELAGASDVAKRAAAAVQAIFPAWKVQSEASADSPAWGILKRADDWPADLIVVGSHGMSKLDRVLIGSVSQRVMAQAACSVRVARARQPEEGTPLHLIIGYDGSTDAKAAVHEVASRYAPANVEVQLITVLDDRIMTAIAAKALPLRPGPASTLSQDAVEHLRAAGFNATSVLVEGEPKQVLLEAIEQWPADCVFVGATGLRGLRRLLIGSVCSAVTAHATCTVEVIRARHNS